MDGNNESGILSANIYNSQREGPKAPKIVHVNEGIITVHRDTKH